ncbi:MAG: c-type cytochrome biogenesis protein CcsB [Nitrospirae bacterium]|nr:c-type cytochrome biogenesis protein CcsB [Nitrospirota bacterium]MBI5696077.1 c-type cytochrome biogenesis protein CcsB [Nitrospirota bacterium]
MSRILFGTTLFFYFLGTFHCLLYLINQREGIGKVCQVATIAGFGFHTLSLIYSTVQTGYVPMTNIRESLAFYAWAIVLIYLILEYRYKIRVLGAFVIPLAFIAIVVSLTFPIVDTPLPEYFKSAWLGIHTTLAFLADAAFAIAFGVGIMYIIQERQLKHKTAGAFYRRLPSLDVLDELNYKSVAIGFPLLTLAIVSGSIWANSVWGNYWGWEPKEIWSLITWLVYAVYLHARLISGWRGRKAAYLAVAGFLIVIFTFLGVNLLLPGKHAFQ